MDPNEVDQVDQMGQNEDRAAGLVAGWTAARSRTKTASPTAGRPVSARATFSSITETNFRPDAKRERQAELSSFGLPL